MITQENSKLLFTDRNASPNKYIDCKREDNI